MSQLAPSEAEQPSDSDLIKKEELKVSWLFLTPVDAIPTQGGGPERMKNVVAHFKELNGAKGWGQWEVDQVHR